jgi:hypothetical protein
MPLSPFVPASNVRITNDPLLDIVPLPEYNVTEPPVPASEAPASTPTLPPALLLPLPTVRSNNSPQPPFAGRCRSASHRSATRRRARAHHQRYTYA